VTLRFIDSGPARAGINMGTDEAILEAVADGLSPPTLRFYSWSPPAVSIGYFQGLEAEVDTDECRRRGVDVVRRVTGGGAVFHDDELTYSLILPDDGSVVSGGPLESYVTLCAGVIEGLRELGLQASFAPINDVTVDGRKVSGNAQTRKRGCILQHGTVLLGLDVDAMFSLLKVPDEKLRGRLVADVKARVASVSALRGSKVDYPEAARAFARGFSRALGADLLPRAATGGELVRADAIAREKYDSASWTARRP